MNSCSKNQLVHLSRFSRKVKAMGAPGQRTSPHQANAASRLQEGKQFEFASMSLPSSGKYGR